MPAKGRVAAADGKAAKRRRVVPRADEDVIVIQDEDDAMSGSRAGGSGGDGSPALPTVQRLLAKLEALQQTQVGREDKAGSKQATQHGKGKKKAAVEMHSNKYGWSKGTGFGGSHDTSKRDEDMLRRTQAKEEEIDNAFTGLVNQLLSVLEQQTAKHDTCFMLLSCSGLAWGVHRLLSNQSLLEIGRRSAAYKRLLALLSFFARSDQCCTKGTHVYASLLVAPLHPRGWAQPPPRSEPDPEAPPEAAPSLEVPRRSGRAAKKIKDKHVTNEAGRRDLSTDAGDKAPTEAELAAMDTIASLLQSLQAQASLFVSLTKSSGAARGDEACSGPKSKSGGGKVVGKEGGADDETANALALNLFISDTADAVKKIVDTCIEKGQLVPRGHEGNAVEDGCTEGQREAGLKRERDTSEGLEGGRGLVGGRAKGKEAKVDDKAVWTEEDDAAYRLELGPKRFKTIALLEMVEKGRATFALDVDGPAFSQPPKPMWGGMPSMAGHSVASLLSQISSSSPGPPNAWMAAVATASPPGVGGPSEASGLLLPTSALTGPMAGTYAGSGSGSSMGAAAGKPSAQTMRGRMTRIASEITSLASNLPIEAGSSIFVRVDEDRPDVLKALIVGPEDTPYENGLFEFDILLPLAYPESPPQVRLITTGGGRVRFNPNLYQDGKVCLSLLGTWTGPSWNAATSTLLQVLVSIQALILVPDPYFNEPGFEGSMGTKQGAAASKQYNTSIRRHTLKVAIHEQLTNTKSVFRDVILRHCLRKRSKLLAQCDLWKKEADALKATAEKEKSSKGGEGHFPDSDLHSLFGPGGLGMMLGLPLPPPAPGRMSVAADMGTVCQDLRKLLLSLRPSDLLSLSQEVDMGGCSSSAIGSASITATTGGGGGKDTIVISDDDSEGSEKQPKRQKKGKKAVVKRGGAIDINSGSSSTNARFVEP